MNEINNPRAAGDVLTFGFGATVAMWAVGYLSRLPGFHIPSSLVFAALVACLVAGGFLAGALTHKNWKIGLAAGLLTGLLNLLILGSLLAGAPSAVLSAATFIAGCAIAGALSAQLGSRMAPMANANPSPINWTSWFARVAAAAVLLLVTVGGVVTSEGAGLSVVDWPNSFGYNMFLYPIARMTGGIYYEHAHRLIGSLVGLTVVALTVHLWLSDRRRWVKWFAVAVIGAVVCQGILGGLRVTGYFTWSHDPASTAPNIILAIVHGVFGQTIFGAVVALCVFTSASYRSHLPATVRPNASTDRSLGILLMLLLVTQLVIGAVLRHISHGLMLHITIAVFALALAIGAGTRALFLNEQQVILTRIGAIMLSLALVQLSLGIASLIITWAATRPKTDVSVIRAIITTGHQAVGALLLATAVTLTLWSFRLLRNEKLQVD